MKFANRHAVNGDKISTPVAKLGHVANSLVYNQDLDTHDTIVIVADNKSYDSNITNEQAKAEIKERLKMVAKVTGFPSAQIFGPAPPRMFNYRVAILPPPPPRLGNLTKEGFTADGIHPNQNGTSIIIHAEDLKPYTKLLYQFRFRS